MKEKAVGEESVVRPVDRARVSQLVIAQLVGDQLMFAEALNEIVYDEFGLDGKGAIINSLLVMSQDLAGILAGEHGDAAVDLVRAMLARQLAEVDDGVG
jgi:hypothetical protein